MDEHVRIFFISNDRPTEGFFFLIETKGSCPRTELQGLTNRAPTKSARALKQPLIAKPRARERKFLLNASFRVFHKKKKIFFFYKKKQIIINSVIIKREVKVRFREKLT